VRLDLSVAEWVVLQGLLEASDLLPDDQDAVHVRALRSRVRAITGRALQALEGPTEALRADQWLDNQRTKVGRLVPPSIDGGTSARTQPDVPRGPRTSLDELGAALGQAWCRTREDRHGLTSVRDALPPPPVPAEPCSVVDDEPSAELYAEPSRSDMDSPDFVAVWDVIKSWLVSVPALGRSRLGPSTPNQAMAVVRSLRSRWDFESDSRRRT
jgi:hypothetical protein